MGMGIPKMPFKVLALAPFAMNGQIPWKQPPITVDLSNLDQVIESIGISGYFPVPRDLCPAGGVEIKISRIKDFHPDRLVQNSSFLSRLLEAREILSDKKMSVAQKKQKLEEWPDLPELPIEEEAGDAKYKASDGLDNILNMVAMPGDSPGSASKPLSGGNPVDAIIQGVLANVYSARYFRDAESAWQGVKLLLQKGGDVSSDFRLNIVPVALETLDETIGILTARLIDDLPSFIFVDLPFDNTPNSMALLEKVAQFAEILMAPVMAWASPGLMDLSSWSELNRLSFIPHYLDDSHFAKFNRLKAQPEANWLALACNRFLFRYPYGSENRPRNFPFEEPGLPWSSSVWGISALILESFIETGWPTRFTDWRAYQLEDLAVHYIDSNTASPSEALISEDRMDQCRRAGLMPLATMANRDIAFIPMETTIGGASLAYQLFAARVTQFLLWCRDNLAPDLSGQSLENELSNAFSSFWVKSGHPGPESLVIEAGPPDDESRIPLKIDLYPSHRILSSRERLTLEFRW